MQAAQVLDLQLHFILLYLPDIHDATRYCRVSGSSDCSLCNSLYTGRRYKSCACQWHVCKRLRRKEAKNLVHRKPCVMNATDELLFCPERLCLFKLR